MDGLITQERGSEEVKKQYDKTEAGNPGDDAPPGTGTNTTKSRGGRSDNSAQLDTATRFRRPPTHQ